MFEKEAEERVKYLRLSRTNVYVSVSRVEYWKDGAVFGYNKAKEDANKMKSRFLELCNLKDMRIAELEKANEWHDLRENPNDLPSDYRSVWTNKGGACHDNYGWYDDCGYVFGVIAWCEPKFEDN